MHSSKPYRASIKKYVKIGSVKQKINKNKSLLHVVRWSTTTKHTSNSPNAGETLMESSEMSYMWHRYICLALRLILTYSLNLLWYMAQQCCRLFMRKGHWRKVFRMNSKYEWNPPINLSNSAKKKYDSLIALVMPANSGNTTPSL